MVTIQKKKTEDTSEVITTMTEVAYYDLHILLCHYCNYGCIAKNLTQGATEEELKTDHSVALALADSSAVSFEIS